MHPILALRAFFRVLFQGEPPVSMPVAPAPAVAPPAPAPAFAHSTEPAIQLLALLQKEGRLMDFLREDIGSYKDAEIGAAVRDIHRGCRSVLERHATLRAVVTQKEGQSIDVPAGFDPSQIALQGNVSGAGPFRGTVAHPGWYVEALKLPTVPPGADPKVVAPAQVEVR
ncbi:DUF2760 domain-containing protein [bacterium]|nr:DUF2760 domain-containing protein [bacterium]